ncbi:FCD domain-containing protein [Strepomyces sp. STD 3.1]|nr:FCD domain-containing protein [Streptomyces sp. STD 3.1]
MRGLPDKGHSHAEYGGHSHAEYGRFAVLDQRFHDALAVASGRTMLAAAVERLHTHLHLFRLSPVSGGSPATVMEHGRILRAVLRRSPGRASEAMREHLESSLRRHRDRYAEGEA